MLVFIYVSVYWVFPDEIAKEDDLMKDLAEDKSSEVEASRTGRDWAKLLFWLQIEAIMFGANLFSNMMFLFIRSCSHSRIPVTKTDSQKSSVGKLEEQQILVGLCSSYLSPLIVTTCIVNSGWREYAELDDQAQSLANAMVNTQFLQSALVFFIAFVPYYRDNKSR